MVWVEKGYKDNEDNNSFHNNTDNVEKYSCLKKNQHPSRIVTKDWKKVVFLIYQK